MTDVNNLVTWTEKEQSEAFSAAKTRLFTTPALLFYATLLSRTTHRYNEKCPTAWTDGLISEYGPSWMMVHCKNTAQRAGTILHELLHIALEHVIRGQEYGWVLKKANIAADYYINLIIDDLTKRNCGVELPEGCLLDYKYVGWSLHEIYQDLPENSPAPNMQDLLEPGELGNTSSDPRPAQEVQVEIEQVLAEAVIATKRNGEAVGTIPGEVERLVDRLLNPKVPWYRVLRRMMTNFAKTEYSMQKVNRRFAPDWLLPTMYGEAICDIASSVDVSASVTTEQFNAYVSESCHIFRQLKPQKMSFLQWDTQVKQIDECRSEQDLLNVEFAGWGGTDIEPVLEWAQENKPKVLLVFTDGEFPKPRCNPKIPVIWIIVGNKRFTAPFGKVIHYNE